jgi:hypothetical protein
MKLNVCAKRFLMLQQNVSGTVGSDEPHTALLNLWYYKLYLRTVRGKWMKLARVVQYINFTHYKKC